MRNLFAWDVSPRHWLVRSRRFETR